jgi:hypothetical protein
VALQGDLKSFALPDVLRLLAGTTKSGRLDVRSSGMTGELCLQAGAILSGSTSASPSTASVADVVFELLRVDHGSFVFEEGEELGDGPVVAVDDALSQAEELLAEWAEVEAVIPSMDAWIALAPEVDDDGVHISSEQWRALVSIAGGGSVRDLASALSLSDLAASRLTMGLVGDGLASVQASNSYRTSAFDAPIVELDSFEEFELAPGAERDLEDLGADDHAVVMEERDDALLPEPLPGEGVAYEGETITGSVDGRAFEATDLDVAPTDDAAAGAEFDPDESFATVLDEAAVVDAAPFAGEDGGADFGSEISDEPRAEDEGESALDAADGADEQPSGDLPEDDDERGSLLRFLSSVKP